MSRDISKGVTDRKPQVTEVLEEVVGDRLSRNEPERFGAYRLVSPLAWGGAGAVFRARPIEAKKSDDDVALKILKNELAHDTEMVALFRREAYILSMLHHPNIVRTFEAGIEDGQLFIAMEFVDGCDLYGLLQRCRASETRIPATLAVAIACEVLKGLAAAHDLCDADGLALSLVHRDLKPSNVFLSFGGHVRLGDFGVAAIAGGRGDMSTDLGTAGYFAPEQFTGRPFDSRSDLFSLGAILFEMLSAESLFGAETREATMELNARGQIRRLQEVRADLPTALCEVVDKALQRGPEERYQHASQMREALEAVVSVPAGIHLGIAAFIRDQFLSRYKESIFGEPLRPKPGEGNGRLIGLAVADLQRRESLATALLANRYWTECYDTPATLGVALKVAPSPTALLVDIASGAFPVADVLQQLATAPALVPMIGLAHRELSSAALTAGFELGAMDILLEPVRVPRLLTAVEMATVARTHGPESLSELDGEKRLKSWRTSAHRMLFISGNPSLVARHSRALFEWGFRFDVASGEREAVERFAYASYRAIIYDVEGGIADCRRLVRRIRQVPGIAILPVLGLTDANLADASTGLKRVMLRRRSDEPVLLGGALQELFAKLRAGRAFVRVAAEMTTELRYAGRQATAHTTDISRLGAGLQCSVAPAVGAAVELVFHLPGVRANVEARGIVARVDHPTSSDQACQLGVSIIDFTMGHERAWIGHIESLV